MVGLMIIAVVQAIAIIAVIGKIQYKQQQQQ